MFEKGMFFFFKFLKELVLDLRYYMSYDKFFRYIFQYDYVERERCGEHLLAVFEATLGNLFLHFFSIMRYCFILA